MWRCARFLQLKTEQGQKQPDIVKQTAVTLTLQATLLSAVSFNIWKHYMCIAVHKRIDKLAMKLV